MKMTSVHRIVTDIKDVATQSAKVAGALPIALADQSKTGDLLRAFKLLHASSSILSQLSDWERRAPASRTRPPSATARDSEVDGSPTKQVQRPPAPLLPPFASPEILSRLLADEENPVVKLAKEAADLLVAVRDRVLPQVDVLNRMWKDEEISRALQMVETLSDRRAIERVFFRKLRLPEMLQWTATIATICPLLINFEEMSTQLARTHARATAILVSTTNSNDEGLELSMPSSTIDIAIVTVLPEEYAAVHHLLHDPTVDHGTVELPNLFGWETGSIRRGAGGAYSVSLALAARAGNVNCSQAIIQTVERWNPRYVVLLGIAGGLSAHDLSLGDVVISSVIYGYEYGKLERKFIPRHNWIYHPDDALFASALRFSTISTAWSTSLATPDGLKPPRAIPGVIASGDKVVDDPTNEFFSEVLASFPSAKAVEMEGVGAATAIDVLRAKGRSVGFVMIRGISDLPKPIEERSVAPTLGESAQTRERDATKVFAAKSAASFAVRWISEAWPCPPKVQPAPPAQVQENTGLAERSVANDKSGSAPVKDRAPLTTIHDADASNILLDWFEKLTDKQRRSLIRFSDVDERLGLPRGTAKRLLKRVVSEHYDVHNEGDSTIMFRRRPSHPAGFGGFGDREA